MSCALLTLLYFQTLMTFENGKLVQKQTWDGKTTTLERELQDGKLIAVRFNVLLAIPFSAWFDIKYAFFISLFCNVHA